MFHMSFFDGSLDRDKLKAMIRETQKPIVYTYGFAFRNPTTYRLPVSKSDAIKIVNDYHLLDAREEQECLHLNAYSSNDMW